MAVLGVKLVTPISTVRHATDWAMEPGEISDQPIPNSDLLKTNL